MRLGFGQHPDAEIYLSQPGLGTILGARVLAEMGDDPDRYADARARKNYAGMAPITRASGTKRVVLARYARNRRLADALYQQAMSALSASPGARAYYDRHRARGATHHQALRALGNRLVGILHGCLRHHHQLQREHRLATEPTAERRRLTPSSRGISRWPRGGRATGLRPGRRVVRAARRGRRRPARRWPPRRHLPAPPRFAAPGPPRSAVVRSASAVRSSRAIRSCPRSSAWASGRTRSFWDGSVRSDPAATSTRTVST